MLYIFKGLPGVGKTTLARHVARTRKAVHVRIDTIEQALRDTGLALTGPEGYVVAYRLAADNLCLDGDVVADSVNPLHVTRNAWREVANNAGVRAIKIEVICSDIDEHLARVESRLADICHRMTGRC
jgi:predicted kinase